MFDSFCESITNFSSNITDVNFSDRYYRQLMTQLLNDIERHGVIKLQDLKNKYISELTSFCDNQSIRITSKKYECKERDVQARLNEEARQLVEPFQRMLNNKLESFAKQVNTAVQDCIKPTNKALEDLKKTVGDKLKTAGKDYLDNLKAQIKEKEQTLKEVNALQDCLTPLQELIKA